jgi:hypothetical protein
MTCPELSIHFPALPHCKIAARNACATIGFSEMVWVLLFASRNITKTPVSVSPQANDTISAPLTNGEDGKLVGCRIVISAVHRFRSALEYAGFRRFSLMSFSISSVGAGDGEGRSEFLQARSVPSKSNPTGLLRQACQRPFTDCVNEVRA